MDQKANSIEIILALFRRIFRHGLLGSKISTDTKVLSPKQILRAQLSSGCMLLLGLGTLTWSFKNFFETMNESVFSVKGGDLLLLLFGLYIIFLGFGIWPWRGRN